MEGLDPLKDQVGEASGEEENSSRRDRRSFSSLTWERSLKKIMIPV